MARNKIATTFIYYEDNRRDARREVPVADLAAGFAVSQWAGADYDGWPVDRRLGAYLTSDVHASYDARDPEFTAGCKALLSAACDVLYGTEVTP